MDFKTVLTVISMVVAGVAAFFAYQGSNQTELHKLDKRISKLELTDPVPGPPGEPGKDGVGVPIPDGLVIASLKRCDDLGTGWQSYDDGAGRMIVGVGETEIAGTKRTFLFEETDGYWEHELTPEQMPRHNHRISTGQTDNWGHDGLSTQPGSPAGIDWVFNNPDPSIVRSGGYGIMPDVLEVTGGGQAHNNMPPYIALYFCKKEG